MNWLTEKESRAWIGYRRMRLLLDLQLGRELMSQSGLSEPDYDVMSSLSAAEDHTMRITDLANHMRWSKSRLSHHVSRMQERGLVERRECPSDARGSLLALTEQGWQALQDAAPGHVTSVRKHMIDLMTEEELEVLANFSHRIAAHLGENPRS